MRLIIGAFTIRQEAACRATRRRVVQGRLMCGWTEIDAPRLATVRRTPLRATFVERPHRFAAWCILRGGADVGAHVPNPGRLTGVLAPRCQVLLDGPYPATRALPYTMVAARPGREPGAVWIGTNTIYANKVFPALVTHGLFPELDGSTIRAEVVHGHSRFDFLVGDMMVEVKSVTLASGSAGAFPDAVSARAARHCAELAALCDVGPTDGDCLRRAERRRRVGGARRRGGPGLRRRASRRGEGRRHGARLRARHHAGRRHARAAGAGGALAGRAKAPPSRCLPAPAG